VANTFGTNAIVNNPKRESERQQANQLLARSIALGKVLSTRCFEYCAREASQVLGGNSCIRGGVGDRIERLYREVRCNAIAGGSEEILLELGTKLAKL